MPKILMVDDSEIAWTLTRIELVPFGYEVVQAETIDDALTSLERDPTLSAVLLDVSVAELLGGREVVARMRRTRASGRLPIIIHSAMRDHELHDKTEALGADGYYRKGGRLLDLVEHLRKLCGTEEPLAAR